MSVQVDTIRMELLQLVQESIGHVQQASASVWRATEDWAWVLGAALLLSLAYGVFRASKWLYELLFVPMNYVRPLSSVGYVPYDGDDQQNLVRRVRENRLAGDLPPLYPNGWYGLVESFTVQRGEAKPFHFCGQNVVIFRDMQGAAHVLDAYCPHLGAHLGAGGRVVGNCIECPFHGWRFDGTTGKCTHIPYSERIPEQARVRSWNVCEVNQWIYAWYDAEERDPFWTIPEIPEITQGKLTYRGRTEQFLNGHIEEVPLNGADVVHLKVVHSAFIGAGVDLSTMGNSHKFLEHLWSANWKQSDEPDEKHIGLLYLEHALLAFGYCVPLTRYQFTVQQIGPAVVTLTFDLPLGRAVFLQSVQPVEPLVQRIVHNIYASWTVPTLLAKMAMLAEAKQVERDLMIWNNKQFHSKPLFVKSMEDSLLLKHRRWYSQFYSEHSPRMVVQPRVRYGKPHPDKEKTERSDSGVQECTNGGEKCTELDSGLLNGVQNGNHKSIDW